MLEKTFFIAYEPPTGRIDHVRQTSAIARYLGDGFDYLEIDETQSQVDGGLYYITTGGIVPRPVFPIVDQDLVVGQEVALALPAGTVIRTEDNQEHILADGLLELSGDIADTYQLALSLWPYVDQTVKVTIHEA